MDIQKIRENQAMTNMRKELLDTIYCQNKELLSLHEKYEGIKNKLSNYIIQHDIKDFLVENNLKFNKPDNDKNTLNATFVGDVYIIPNGNESIRLLIENNPCYLKIDKITPDTKHYDYSNSKDDISEFAIEYEESYNDDLSLVMFSEATAQVDYSSFEIDKLNNIIQSQSEMISEFSSHLFQFNNTSNIFMNDINNYRHLIPYSYKIQNINFNSILDIFENYLE